MTEENFITTTDIVNRIHAHKNVRNVYTKRVSKKIIREYFELVQKAVLDGYEWDFPCDFGGVAIYKNALKEGQLPNISKVESLRNKRATISYNPKTVGFYYSIQMQSPVLEKTGMTFRANPTLKRKLFERAYNTNKDYRSK